MRSIILPMPRNYTPLLRVLLLLTVSPILLSHTWAATWTTQTTTGSPAVPGVNDYSGAGVFDHWQQRLLGWWRSSRTPNNIYSDSLQTFDPATNAWRELAFNSSADVNNAGAADTATMPGSGHISQAHTLDWRHDWFVIHTRYASGANKTSLYTWLDNKDAPSTGFPAAGPFHQLLSSTTPVRYDVTLVYDPLNNKIWEFAGLVNGSTLVNTMDKIDVSAGTLTAVAYNTSVNPAPAVQAETGGFFDYYYADHNPGESRVCWYGGNWWNGSAVAPGQTVQCFYPNGSVAKGYPANSWGPTTGNGEATNAGPLMWYGYAGAYDTKRDVYWAYQDTTHVQGLSMATMTWTSYSVTGGPSDCPQLSSGASACGMIYDSTNDQLILTDDNGAGVARISTVSVQNILSVSALPCGAGNYKTSATATYIPRPLPYPALNTQYSDPLGGCVTRVTSVTDGAPAPASYTVPIYSQVKPTDSSERFFVTVNNRVLDTTNNYQDLGIDLSLSVRAGNYVWARTTAATLIGMDVNNTNLIKKWNITTTGSGAGETGTLNFVSTMVNLSSKYQTCAGSGAPAMGFGSQMNQVSQQDRDKFDNHIVLTCQKNGLAEIVMVVVNLQLGTSGAEFPIASGLYTLSSCTAGNPTVCTASSSMAAGITANTQVNIASAAGGTWASLNGQRTVTSVSGTTLTLTFNSTGFGTYTASSGTAGFFVPNSGGCDPRFGPNYAWTGYLDNYVLVDWGMANTGNNSHCGVEAYNLANAANPAGSWTLVGQVIPDSTHLDLMAVSGVEYLVGFASNSPWGSFNGTITACAVPDGWSRDGAHSGCTRKLSNPNGGGHITSHAFNAPTPFFLFDDDGGQVDVPWYPRMGEIVKVYWDSTDVTPHIERIAHTRTDTNWFVACNTCQASSYWSQAKTTLNLDGSKAWFASSWGPGDGVNTYQLSLQTPPTGPVVSNVRIPAASLSHGSAQVLFDTPAGPLSASACGAAFNPGQACWRLRLNTAACSGGSGGTVFNPDYHAAGSNQYSMALNLTGLAPNTTYNVCPEASNDGIAWSTGVSQSFTTLPLPAVHPAPPIAPTPFAIPASPAIGGGACGSGSGTCAVAVGCGTNGSSLQTALNTAVWGDTITIPVGTVCASTTGFTLPTAPDAKSFAPANVTTSTSTINLTAHGYGDQQQVRLSSTICLPGTIVPRVNNGNEFFNCKNTGGLLPGYPYYVKLVDANNFQLSLTPGGPVYNFGYVVFTATVSGSTITIQPSYPEQGYAAFNDQGLLFDTTNPFQINTTGTLPAGLSLNTDYYFKTNCSSVIKCTTQLALTNGGAAVTITDAGTGVHTITHKGYGTHYVLKWPPANPAYVTVRTAAPDSQLPPDGVRISPIYLPAMATLQQNKFYGDGINMLSTGILSHNYRFGPGLEITTGQNGATDLLTTVDPRPYGNWLALGADSGNVIFDRDYLHGRGYPNRLGRVAVVWNGMNTAIVNSYLDQQDYWHPVITSGFAPSFTSSSVTLTAGSGYATRALHPVTSTNTVIAITGGAATGTGSVYVDMAGVMQVRIPIGMTATCTVTGISCVVTPTASTGFPVDPNGRVAGFRLATFNLTAGVVTAASQADPAFPSESSEGSQAIIAGLGPGPYNFSNNYDSGTGIMLHFDDGGNHYPPRADYTVKRNFWNIPASQMQGGPLNDGLRYQHRQPLEWKGGKRIAAIGNEFTGQFADATRSGHTMEMSPRSGGVTTDVDWSWNFIHDGYGAFSTNGAIEGGAPMSYPLLRFRVANNLVYKIDGTVASHLATVQANFDAPGWMASGDFAREDIDINHNTFYDIKGSVPSFQNLKWTVTEGWTAKDNLIWLGTGTTGIDFAGGEEVQSNTGTCAGLTGKAGLDCAMVQGPGAPNYKFSNVMIPAGTNTQPNIQTVYGSLLTAAQVPVNAAAIGWANTVLNNYRLRSSSAYISGGHNSTDGLDVGVNQDTLEDALGWIKNVRALNITSTGATIAFHAPDAGAACRVAYGTGPTGTWTATAFNPLTWSASPADTSVSQERAIGLSGLSAKTEYFYQVWCGGTAPTTTRNLRTR